MDTDSRPNGTHEWRSPSYVAEWIRSDATRDDERRPLLHRVAGLIPAGSSRTLHVLDVGGGYGALSAAVLERRPEARVTLLDYSDAMISAARARLEPYGARVGYLAADLTATGWFQGLDEPVDAVVSAYAIHNLGEPELIRNAYRDLFGTLRAGGVLISFDLLFPASPALAAVYQRDPTRSLNWDPRVSPLGLESHLGWLRDAGFTDVDCLWKDLEQGILWARRSA